MPPSVSLPLPPAFTVTGTLPLACPSLTLSVTVEVPVRPGTVEIAAVRVPPAAAELDVGVGDKL